MLRKRFSVSVLQKRRMWNEWIQWTQTLAFLKEDLKVYTYADLKISLYSRVQVNIILKFLIRGTLELFTRKVSKMFVYEHTETLEYV